MRSADPTSLFERARKIRLPLKDWAAKAGVNQHTLLRLRDGKNHLQSSVSAAEQALVDEESELAQHLRELGR